MASPNYIKRFSMSGIFYQLSRRDQGFDHPLLRTPDHGESWNAHFFNCGDATEESRGQLNRL
jgi:hypothetical protein